MPDSGHFAQYFFLFCYMRYSLTLKKGGLSMKRCIRRWVSISLIFTLLVSGSSTSVMAAETSAPAVSAQESEDGFAAKIEEAYDSSEMQFRPYARWWLAEGSHTDETLIESIHELYDAGYGGVEFVTLDESKYLDKETYAWGSPEWIHDTHVIIEECQKLGMSVSMTSGTHWATANLVSITPDDRDYDLFAFYQYGTGEAYKPAVSNSYTINYLSTKGAEALIDYWDSSVLTEEVQTLIDQIDECDLYMDSLELSVHGSRTSGQL